MLPNLSPSQKLSVLLLAMMTLVLSIMGFYHLRLNEYEVAFQQKNLHAMQAAQKDVSIIASLNLAANATTHLIEQHEAEPMNQAMLKTQSAQIMQWLAKLNQHHEEANQLRQELGIKEHAHHQQQDRDLQAFNEQLVRLLTILPQNTESAENEMLQTIPLLQRIQSSQLTHLQSEINNTLEVANKSYLEYNEQRMALELIILLAFATLSTLLLRAFWRLGKALHLTEQTLKKLELGEENIYLETGSSSFRNIFSALLQFRDTLRENSAIRQQLLQQNSALEDQIQERTAHLKENNQRLQSEIQQRQDAEQQQRLFETVFQHTDDAVLITTPDVHIITANKAYERLTGSPLASLIGQKPNISSSGHHDKTFYQKLWAALQQDGRWRGEIINRNSNGGLIHAQLTVNAVYSEDGSVANYIGILSDISRLKDAKDKLRQMAYFDPLTLLPNRVLLADRLNHEIQISLKEHQNFAIVFLDLDRFKYVNDTLGHTIGDELLKETARRLLKCTHADDTVARLSGDEFCLLIRHSTVSDVALICEKILLELRTPYQLSGREVEIGGSLGIAMYPDDGQDSDQLTKNADAAMYQAKALGRNRYCFFEQAIALRLQDEMALYARLRQAIEQQQFTLHYQPIEALEPSLHSYAESLIRWPQADGSMMPPGVFIPFAEAHGLIEPISEFVLKAASQFMSRCIQSDMPSTVSINLSAKQLARSDLLAQLQQIIAQAGIPASAIELELTESALISNLKTAATTLQSLRSAGFRIAIDDFGAGYSSLNYLVELPIDKVKIDQRFIWTLFNTPRNQAVVKAILELARTIGVQTVAEGVETVEQYNFLRDHGCHYIQGYYLAKPMSEVDYIAFRHPAKVSH